MKKRLFLFVTLSTFCVALLATSWGQSLAAVVPKTRKITDQAGLVVEIPYHVNRVADRWPAHNGIIVMLGAGDKLVATNSQMPSFAWFAYMLPRVKDIPGPFSGSDVNMETLIGSRPDVVFTSKSGMAANTMEKLKAANIAVVQLLATNFAELRANMLITGQVLGPEAEKLANEYCLYLDSNIKKVSSITDLIPKDRRPKVMHTAGPGILYVDGGNSLPNMWMEMAGGVNVAAEIAGTSKQVSIEQVVKWNPDIIIVSGDSGRAPQYKKQMMTDSQWSQINAVKNGKVILNPQGVYQWDRHSAEEALQVLWAAKTLHPDKFPDIDIMKEIKWFYAKFFRYNLTDEKAKLIINGLPPPK